jgi:hypothetical protein
MPGLGKGLNALGLVGNVLDLGGHKEFMDYITRENALGGPELPGGNRQMIDPGMAQMYSGLGAAIPFLGNFMFDRQKYMQDPEYRRVYGGETTPSPWQ